MKDPNCERYIGQAFETDGFFGAKCGTWVGGFSANCKSQQAAAQINRENCYRRNYNVARNDEITQQVINIGKYLFIAAIIYFTVKWYLA